jgi:anti-sigma regulatory factor (Ser/Thr protein kinase)
MRDFSLHILDIVENSIEAGARKVEIEIKEDTKADRLVLCVKDDGRGMDGDLMKKIEDPFFTMKPGKNFGLGVPLLAQAARQCGGSFNVVSEKGRGTEVVAKFQASHIDRKPLGDIASTMVTLVAGHPDVDYSLVCERDGEQYVFETENTKKVLEDVPINLPEVLKLLKDDIKDGIRRTMHER